jgi:peptidoglycan/LPS O-acetylase OafA/YrhL
MNRTPDQRVYFKNLDLLRFVAAYLIVLLHCFFGWKVKFGDPAFLSAFLPEAYIKKLEVIIHNFSFGVDIFFMISGFLLTYLLLSEREKTGKVDVLRFYIRRAYRIWPLYFLLILTAPLLTYFINEQSPTYPYHFFFAGNFDLIENGPKSAATNHLWSICIEEHFYLICPLILGFIPVKRLPQALLGIIFISFIARAFYIPTLKDYGMGMYVHTLSRIDVLAIGSLFGYLVYYRRIKFHHPLPLRVMVYTVFLLLFFNVDYMASGDFLSDTMKKYCFVLPMGYWLANFIFNPTAVSVPKANWFNNLGKASYGIYMFNPVVILLTVVLFDTMHWQNYFLFLLLVHLVLAAVTFLSYRFFEMPFLALKEKYAVVKSGEDREAEALNPEIDGQSGVAVNVIKE